MMKASNIFNFINSYKKYLIVVIASIFFAVIYGTIFPSVYHFKCEGESRITETDNLDKTNFLTEFIKVKKYLYGYQFTINNYDFDQCSILNDEILCSNDEKDWISFNTASSQISGFKDLSYMKKLNIKSERYYSVDCKKIKPAID